MIASIIVIVKDCAKDYAKGSSNALSKKQTIALCDSLWWLLWLHQAGNVFNEGLYDIHIHLNKVRHYIELWWRACAVCSDYL